MTTPSQKPTWLDRYTMIGDTIPMSRTAGGPGGTNRVYVDFGDTTGYPADTKFHGFQEPATSGCQNRPHWSLAEGAAYIYEREIAQPYVHTGATTTGATGPTVTLTDAIIYLGEQGYTTADLGFVCDVLDVNWDELDDGESPPTKIVAADIHEQDPLTSTWRTCYPAGGLPSDEQSAPIATVANPDNYSITTSSPLIGSATGVSLMNYDKWLREVRDAGSPEDAFATIIQWTDNQTFKMHRDISSGGLDWGASDTLFVSHFAYQPRLTVTPAIPTGTTYNLVLGVHNTIGRLDKNALTSIKIRSAEAVPFAVEDFIMGGLDAAYDQLGFGSAGGGRTVTVDSRPVFLDVSRDYDVGLQIGTDTNVGTIGVFLYNSVSGVSTGTLVGCKKSTNAETIWAASQSCQATAGNNQVQLTGGGQVKDGSDLSLMMLDVDVIYLQDSGGNPLNIGSKAPNGLYILDTFVNTTTFTVKYMDGTSPGALMTGAAYATWIRPISVEGTNIIGGSGVRNIKSAYSEGTTGEALSLHGSYKHTGPEEGVYLRAYAGNIDSANAIETAHVSLDTVTANRWVPKKVYRQVGGITSSIILEETMGWSGNETSIASTYAPSQCDAVSRYYLDYTDASGIDMRLDVMPRGLLAGISDGAGNNHTAMLQFGDYENAVQPFSFQLVAEPYDGDKYQYGLKASFASSTLSSALLREDPTGPTAPMGTAADTVLHRNAISVNTDYGWQGWRTVNKKVNMFLGKTVMTVAGAASNWESLVWDGLRHWYNDNDATSDLVYVPILVPHGADIINVKCRYGSSAALAGTVAKLNVVRVDNGAALQDGTGEVVNDLSSGGYVSMNPFNGGTNTATYTYTCNQYTRVDLETYEYFATVECGSAGGASVQRMIEVSVSFRYCDMYPE